MSQPQADELFLEHLVTMGFDPTLASQALLATKNKSVDAAIEYLDSLASAPKITAPKTHSHIQKVNPLYTSLQVKQPTSHKQPASKVKFTKGKHRVPITRMHESEGSSGDDDNSDKEEDDCEGSSEDRDYYSDQEAFINEDEEMFDASDAKAEMATVLDSHQIQATATAEIERIASITETSLATAGALLRAFHWNSEKLLEGYYDNPEKVLKQAGIAEAAAQQITKVVKVCIDCEICGDSLNINSASKLDCSHIFCNSCLEQYLTVQITDGKSLDITCMAFKCKEVINDSMVKALVRDDVYKKYKAFVIKSFVEDNPNVKWCPRPGCGNAVKSDTKNLSEALCSCGYKFCFKCNGEAHAPAVCVMMKLWEKKSKDDSETCNWLSVNTKDCPECNSAIEKNGGCNHMTCRKCRHEFCWICGAKWAGHSSCNKYVEGEGDKKSQDRAALERYLHYFHRYNSHEQSKKFETALRQAGISKMVEMQNSEDSRWIDVQYIDSGTEQLIECRRMLKYTYVFAFYLAEGPEKNLFEYLQSELETTTEQLSGVLEAPIATKEPRQIKDIILLAAKRLQHLIDGVDEMLENKSTQPFISEILSLLKKSDIPLPVHTPVAIAPQIIATKTNTHASKRSTTSSKSLPRKNK